MKNLISILILKKSNSFLNLFHKLSQIMKFQKLKFDNLLILKNEIPKFKIL